jgi:Ribosomal protein S16
MSFLEIVGNYHPQSEPSALTVDSAKAMKWLTQGAQPSERVKKLFEISGVWAEFMATKKSK